MPYCTQQNLIDRYGDDMLRDLTDRAIPLAGAIDATTVTEAIANADAMIDGYLLGRYSLPLATTPGMVKQLSQVIAIYNLHRHGTDEKIRTDYEDALKRLKDIQSGVFVLNVAGVEPAATPKGSVETNGITPAFTGGSMTGLI
jgi:phage gp36-like protein